MGEFKSNGGGLTRQSSSPAGFFVSKLNGSGPGGSGIASAAENGFPGPRGGLGNTNSKAGITRLNSQLSFTRQDSILSHISEEESENGADIGSSNRHVRKSSNSYGNSGYVWPDDPSNAIFFSNSPLNKRAKSMNEVIHSLNREESQLQFGLHQSALEMAAMENLIHIPEDSVPCKIRAKRGCATHPRSIAERERRTRISGKLKKLQDLVPNMDKQTSYADMLDLAVQHIKGLQNQVQELHKDLKNCTCGCSPTK